MKRDSVVQWLYEKGANRQPHGKRTLIDHLLGVESFLKQSSEEVQLAGLCHSIYGTMRYRRRLVSLEDRPIVIDLIGSYSETLVFEFSHINRPKCLFNGNYNGKHIVDLIQIEIANLMEQGQLEKLAQLIHAR